VKKRLGALLVWFGFGYPIFSRTDNAVFASKLKPGDMVVRCTNTLLLPLSQRLRVLVGGSMVVRTQLCVTPEKFVAIGSIIDITVLPPFIVRSAAQIDAINKPKTEPLS